jgi:hypothetical protein
MKRFVPVVVLVVLLALVTAYYFRRPLITAFVPNPKLSPEVEALNRHFPLYGVSHGPMLSTGTIEEAKTQAGKDLRAFYADWERKPPWRAAVRHLAAVDPAQRAQAASYLCDLLNQALKDEQSGVAPWEASPFWGSGGSNPARDIREQIAAALTSSPSTSGAVPVVRWFLENEKLTRLQGEVLPVLTSLNGPEVDDLLNELATRPHANADVAVGALNRLGERKIKVTADKLLPLCRHHRTKVREAARALNAQLGYPAPPLFDSVQAVQTEPLSRLMDEIGRLLMEEVPAETRFVCLTIGDSKPQMYVLRGWLLDENEEQWVVATGFGRRVNVFKKEKQKTTAVNVSIEEEVGRVVALRREGDKNHEMSPLGGLSGQFEGHGASVYEALLAQWLYVNGRFDLAAAILLPALDTLQLDNHLVDITRDRLGDGYAQEMLAAFVGDRDYDKAEQIAKRLAERFGGTRFHALALRLLNELPRRRNDFEGLRLPSPKEWAAEKRKLSRRGQIDYLCIRLRLLNCFQDGQPGGAWYGEAQYAEPCRISSNAAWGQRQGKTEVINPLVELAGSIPGGGEQMKPARSDGLNLQVADIPALAVHLQEDWFLPTVTFWRDFSSNRTLHRIRPLLISLINRIARQQLCRAEKLDVMSDMQREEEITRITTWANDNKDKDETALLLGALENALKVRTNWYQVSPQTAILAERKVKAAIPLVFRFVEEGLTHSFNRDLLTYCNKIDPDQFQELIQIGLKYKDAKVRTRVALLALLTAERATALLILGDALENGTEQLEEIVSALLGGKVTDKAAAVRVFKNQCLPATDSRTRSLIVSRAMYAGIPDGLRLYLRLLEIRGNSIGEKTYDRPVAEIIAEEALDLFGQDRVANEIKKRPAPPEEKIAALKALLKEKIKGMEEGKAPS